MCTLLCVLRAGARCACNVRVPAATSAQRVGGRVPLGIPAPPGRSRSEVLGERRAHDSPSGVLFVLPGAWSDQLRWTVRGS